MSKNPVSTAPPARARTLAAARPSLLRCLCRLSGFPASAAITFWPRPARTAMTEAWVQRHGSEVGSPDYAYAMATDASGDVIVAGFAGSMGGATVKYSGAGVPWWTNRSHAIPQGHGGGRPGQGVRDREWQASASREHSAFSLACIGPAYCLGCGRSAWMISAFETEPPT